MAFRGDDLTMESATYVNGARPQFHGINYRDFIEEVVRRKKARTYLEVGVCFGDTLAKIDCDAIGVDPQFNFNLNPVGKKRRLHLFQMTSDEFFRDYDPRKILGQPLDTAFLDGLHLFEFLLRDFMNTEAACLPNSLIMLDDCFPANTEMAERTPAPEKRQDQQLASWWTGDVWKLLPILQEYRPDLKIVCADTPLTGNVMITNLDPLSTALRDNYLKIVDQYINIELTNIRFQELYETNEIVSTSTILESIEEPAA